MTKRVVLVRHGHGPEDDRVAAHLIQAGYRPDTRRPFAGETLGGVDEDVAGTVIYGGMYNAYDVARHPFLGEEYRWIGAAMAAGIPILGICQGAQMIAHHNGAWVGARQDKAHEFGYYRITPTAAGRDILPGPLVVAQAHYHTFDLPAGAVRLASSSAYENQAFRIGESVYAFQFHAEQTIQGFRRWQNAENASYGQPGAQTREEQTELMHIHDAAQDRWFRGFLTRLFPAGGVA